MYLDDETGRLNLARDHSGRLLFKQAHTQELDAKFELMDDRTSQKMETVQKDRLVAYPIWKRETGDGRWGEDVKGNKTQIRKGDYIDYQGRKILNPYDYREGRVPEYDPTTGRFKIELKHFDYFRLEAEEYNKWFERTRGRKPNYYEKRYPEEAFLHSTLETSEGNSRGWALYYGRDTNREIRIIEKLEKLRTEYEKLDKSIPEEDKWKILKEDQELRQYSQGLLPPETKEPLKMIGEQINEAKKRLEFSRQSSASQEQQAADTAEQKWHMITPIKRLEKHGIRLYAEAAIHAMQKTRDPNNPVVLAVEHIFPERFGGHPEELKWIISKARDRMVDMLTRPEIEYGVSMAPEEIKSEDLKKPEGILRPNPYYLGISKDEAEKLADRHIKATIDTGHINLWRKYWQDDPRRTKEQNDSAFNKWALKSIESLAKDGMVGNVHLADNYGYHDDHLAPGQGNSPVKDIVSMIRKYGYDKAYTVEPGADATTDLSDFHGLMKTWKYFGSPVYGMGFGGGPRNPQTWGDVHYSFFGQNKPPYYIFGAYAPSNDWTLWSAVPLE
jgi:hypothetical protein